MHRSGLSATRQGNGTYLTNFSQRPSTTPLCFALSTSFMGKSRSMPRHLEVHTNLKSVWRAT